MDTTRTVVTSAEYEKVVSFLDHYGIDTDGLDEDEIFEKYEKIQRIRKEQVQVLSRGQTLDSFDRLLSFVPRGYRGYFVRETSLEIARAEALGWQLFQGTDESQAANRSSSTGKSDGLVRLGDLILMILPEENYAALLIAKEERNRTKRLARERKRQQPEQGDETYQADPLFPIKPLDQLGG
jgi:hypothetical protein